MATKKELRALITLAGKVDPSLQSAMLKATGQTKKLSENYKDSVKHASRLSDIIKGSFIGNVAASGFTYLVSKLKELGTEGLELASSLKEVQNVVDTTFASNASQINSFAKSALENFGLSELQAKQFSGTLGAMFKSSGVASEDLTRLSTDLAGLAGDMASFYNLDQEEAFDKIRQGISGETEGLKQLGINMSVANLEAFALSRGINKQYKDMTQTEQALLRYNYLMGATTDQQGDFAKTSGEYANQQRVFRENLKQSAATIASAFLPRINELYKKGNEYLNSTDFVAVAESVANGLELAGKGLKFVADNSGLIIPLLGGVLAYFTAIKAIQFASTFALMANPISLVALVIAGLVATGIALYRSWDDVKASATAFADFMKAWGNSIKDGVTYAFEGMKNKVLENFGILVNGLKKFTNFFKGKDNVNVGFSYNYPKFADGGFSNRPSIFGEAGPEAAIPLKRTPRSYDLLYKTANVLGLKGGSNTTSNKSIGSVAINIYESENPNITKQKVKEAFIELFGDPDDGGRLAFE